MIWFTRKPIAYTDNLGAKVQHCILIAHSGKKKILLSHPNLYLYWNTRSSLETSKRYCNVIGMFYSYLSSQEKFKDIDVTQYHAVADNEDIKRWQVERQQLRARRKQAAASETITREAMLVAEFFRWLNTSRYPTNVDTKTRHIEVNFKSDGMLNYVNNRDKQRTIVDSRTIKILDKERRQKRRKSMISNDEIILLTQSYVDPVYSAIFMLSLGTALRPMEVCRFPYIGKDSNKHIMPYSSMDKGGKVVDYTTLGKGNKYRTIKINLNDLKALEKNYIKPYYQHRKQKYREKYGEECPLDILFLTSNGDPVTEKKIAERTNNAKKRAQKINPHFRDAISFYDARHWWPTQYLIRFFGDRLLTEAADVIYAAAAQVLVDQMGHENISTTFKHYVDMARMVVMTHKGIISELIEDTDVTGFVRQIKHSIEVPKGLGNE